jgi:hypothetical protein
MISLRCDLPAPGSLADASPEKFCESEANAIKHSACPAVKENICLNAPSRRLDATVETGWKASSPGCLRERRKPHFSNWRASHGDFGKSVLIASASNSAS